MIEFTTLKHGLYRAPDITARPRQVLNDTFHRTNEGTAGYRCRDLERREYDSYSRVAACSGRLRQPNRFRERSLLRFRRARQKLNEHIGFIDIIRRFNKRAELP